MQFYQILVWFKRNLKGIILSQRKTIAYLVYGIMISKKAGVAAVGRGMKSNTTVKHNIKRVARYLANDRISVLKSIKKLQEIIITGANRLIISIDWTILHPYQILKATVVGKGRGIPIAFKTFLEGQIKDNQTRYEKELLRYLRSIIPDNIEVIIIADRGFGQKSSLAIYLEKQGFYYILRNKEDIHIKSRRYNGIISNFKTNFNKIYEIKDTIWPRRNKKKKGFRVKSKIVITQKMGSRERWILCSNCYHLHKNIIVKLYKKRMTIEETFRDQKNVDQGFRIKKLRLSSRQRFDKMLLIIAFAYLLLTLFGYLMETKNNHKKIMANTVRYRSISLFQLGSFYFKKYDYSIPFLIKMINEIIYKF